MARNGVWELERLVLRYCPTSGSSKGAREFVETGLIPFAKKNPQIQIKTAIRSGHPHIYGKYITGYARRWCLKNLDGDRVGERCQEMRDTLGRKPPRHSHISNRVVEQRKISVQGVWRNVREPKRLTELQRLQKQSIADNYDMRMLMNNVGLAGIVHITKGLIATREDKRMKAMDALPKRYKVQPTE